MQLKNKQKKPASRLKFNKD